jgi:hypothetical protein
MAGKSLVLTLILCVSAIAARAVAKDEMIPAGTLLHCTLDEPNFSAKTAQAGDPVLCHLGPISTFGHSVFPRGAMLSGHLQDSKDPGHFVGKGWLQLEFDRIILPGAEVLPLSTKIIAAPHLKTDRAGKIKGGGHPRRDVVEWMIPVLWPIKILTLPARGPYPALKGEARLTMRLMEDVVVPLPVTSRASVPSPPWATPTRYTPSTYGLMRPASFVKREPVGTDPSEQQSASVMSTRPADATSSTPEEAIPDVPGTALERSAPPVAFADFGEARSTLVILKGGSAFLARTYWVQGGQIECVSEDGQRRGFPLEAVDVYQTVKTNRERNIDFVLHSKEGAVEQ